MPQEKHLIDILYSIQWELLPIQTLMIVLPYPVTFLADFIVCHSFEFVADFISFDVPR